MRCLHSLVAVLLLSVPSITSAQTSKLYVDSGSASDGATRRTFVIQNGVIIRQWDRAAGDGSAIVVQSTIKTYGQRSTQVGRQYSLTGDVLSGMYTNTG